MSKHILITGASGFLGRHLVMACLKNGWKVYGLDMHQIPESTAMTRFWQAATGEANYRDLVKDVRLDGCFHLAGSANVGASMESPYNDFSKLLPGTARLLEYLVKSQPECIFTLYSSAAVYGASSSFPIREEDPLNPISAYGVHKMLAEKLVCEYARIFGLSAAILRIFSAYGTGLSRQLFWDLMVKYQRSQRDGSQRIEMSGTGNETRDFIHAQDVAQAALLAFEHATPRHTQILNVGNGREVTIREAVETLLARRDYTLTFNGKNRPGDPLRYMADTKKLIKLGYHPTVSLQQGLGDYFDYASGLLNQM